MTTQPQRQRPEIDFPDGPPPQDLQIVDEVVGEGTEAQAGMTVRAHYVGVAYSTGEEFDASWNRGQPLDFRSAWDRSSRAGTRDRRGCEWVAGGGYHPRPLAYGDRGAGGAIAPGEALIFVVDLVDAR